MKNKTYRLKDLEERVDRDKTTLIRWERDGLIPKAERDSRGWRYYSGEQVKDIVSTVMNTNYFRNLPKESNI